MGLLGGIIGNQIENLIEDYLEDQGEDLREFVRLAIEAGYDIDGPDDIVYLIKRAVTWVIRHGTPTEEKVRKWMEKGHG